MNDSEFLRDLGDQVACNLRTYTTAGVLDEDDLVARRLFENTVGYLLQRSFDAEFHLQKEIPEFAPLWDDFLKQNIAYEKALQHHKLRAAYEQGRTDQVEAIAFGWTPAPILVPTPAPRRAEAPPRPFPWGLEGDAETPPAAKPNGPRRPVAPTGPQPDASPAAAADPARAPSGTGEGRRLRISEALERYLAAEKERRGTDAARVDDAPVVQFMADFLGDPYLDEIQPEQLKAVDKSLPEIPDRKGLPRKHCVSFMARYAYAKAHGWSKLKRLTVTTLENRYWNGLNKFFGYLIRENLYRGGKPKFGYVSNELLAPLPRDAFSDDELIAIFEQPLFTGCLSAARIWQPGDYFLQNHLYWGYLILALTGMRTGEVGQLRPDQLRTDGEFFYFDLRPFDPAKGRVALKELPQQKTENAARVVPIHPLLVDLGLIDHIAEVTAAGCNRIFPDWVPYQSPSGVVKWGQPISKSWQYLKRRLKIARADITVYSTRHLMAEWLDSEGISSRTRNRILGHATNVSEGYGGKHRLNRKEAKIIAAIEPPVVARLRQILMTARRRADQGELTVLKPWLSRSRGGSGAR